MVASFSNERQSMVAVAAPQAARESAGTVTVSPTGSGSRGSGDPGSPIASVTATASARASQHARCAGAPGNLCRCPVDRSPQLGPGAEVDPRTPAGRDQHHSRGHCTPQQSHSAHV